MRGKAAEAEPAPVVSAQQGLWDLANKMFLTGEPGNGHQALYAYALLNPSAFDEYPLHYIPYWEQPRWFMTWGIGVQYTVPKDYSGFPPLIGDEVESSTATREPADMMGVDPRSGATSGASASKSKYGNINVDVPIGMLIYYTGDYGVRLYKRLNERRQNEYFGKVLATMPERVPGEGQGGVANRAQQENNQVQSFFAHRTRPMASAGDGSNVNQQQNQPPGASPDGVSEALGNARGGAAGTKASLPLVQRWSVSAQAKDPGSVTGLIMPGVVSVGEGKTESLIERAKKMELDALIVMEVKIQKEKNSHYSTTVLRVYDLKDDSKKWVINAKGLRNNLVAKEREKTRESNDPVELELDKVFREFVDVKLRVQPLKDWDALKASEYVDSLLENKADSLRAATETLGLFRMGILPADKCKSALDELLGAGTGTLLMAGKESDKQAFLMDLVKDFNRGSNSLR